MAHSQTNALLIEIQTLKRELDSSKTTVDQYASCIAKLYIELDNLRSSICQACKKKFVPGILAPVVTVTVPSMDSGSPSSSSPNSISLLRPMFQNWKSQHHSRSPVNITSARNSSNRLVITPIGPAAVPGPTTTATVGGSDERTTNSPEWSVTHNPEVKKALDLHVVHVFTESCYRTCSRREDIYQWSTGSNICVLVDRYIKDPLRIYSVQFSPDGQLVATAGSDDRIRVWDITQRRMRATFRGRMRYIDSIAFSPDGHYLVSGSIESVDIWNIRDGSSRELTDNADWFPDVAFSPDGRYTAAGNVDYSLRIWDARTTKLIARCQGHTDYVRCVKFTPDGKGLMCGSADKTFKYWDASSLGIHQAGSVVPEKNLGEIRRFEGHNNAIRSIACFPRNTRWVLTCSDDGSIRVWDTETGIWQLCLQGRAYCIPEADVSPTGTFLVTADGGCCVTLWKYKEL